MRVFLIAFAVACVAFSTVTNAEGPKSSPYGALRGRVRYVEGPHRVRERVRWGNGLTPTGGQVLIQGIAGATQVFGARGDDANTAPGDPTRHASNLAAYGRLYTSHDVALQNLNKTREKLGLASLNFEAEATQPPFVAEKIQSEAKVENFGDDFTGGEEDFQAKNPVSLFPKVDASMRQLLTSWNTLAAKTKQVKIKSDDMAFAKDLHEGLINYFQKMKSVHDRYKIEIPAVESLPQEGTGADKGMAEVAPAEWTQLVTHLKNTMRLNADALAYSVRNDAKGKILESNKGIGPTILKTLRVLVKELSLMFDKATVAKVVQ